MVLNRIYIFGLFDLNLGVGDFLAFLIYDSDT